KIILSDKDNKSKQSLDETEKSMISKLTGIGVDVNKDLSVKDYVSNFKSYWISKTDVILTKQFQLIVHDAKTIQKVFFEFQKLGISNVTIEKLEHSRIEQYRREVKIEAIKAAKEKAEALAAAVNQSIGKALYIKEEDFMNPYLTSNALQGRLAGINVKVRGNSSDFSDESASEIEFEKIKIEYSILARFELK
ncbi:MAG: SIMPL domain-containing protein, partial [Bacteroidota bacterium]|nr:SIMPL domain-containing protein [Bacteroidota bacterium]